ncbi:MAG: hypothetical protein R3E32_28930 [Chitinophagales bacterium]
MRNVKIKSLFVALILLLGISSPSIQAQPKFNKGEKAKAIAEKLAERKNDIQTQVSSIDPAEVEAQVEAKFEEILAMVEEVSANLHAKAADYVANNCADVTHSESTKTVLIDFGSTPCVGSDGRTRSGSLSIQYIGSERESNQLINVTFDDYFSNGYGVDGSIQYKSIGRDSEGHLNFAVTVNSGTITQPDGKTATFVAQLTKAWVNGENTENPLDDVFETTGTTSGKLFDGTTFQTTTTIPLRYKLACLSTGSVYAVSGIRTMTTGGGDTYIVNYGAGMCDKKVTVTVNGVPQTVTLP